MNVDILDIGSGNISSIKNWLESSNIHTSIVSKVNYIKSDLLVLPGVGSAGSYMERLKLGGYDQAILEHVDKGGRLLGICLGFQIMSSYSDEDGGVAGLGLIKGSVERLQGNVSHNGWESFYLNKKDMNGQCFQSKEKLSRKRILDGRVFYNHEYGFLNLEEECYSIPISETLPQYSGLLVKDNIIGIQFHPEKSQMSGSQLISMIL
jgi:imidazole glycerol-phosphate synthase subunit HisH